MKTATKTSRTIFAFALAAATAAVSPAAPDVANIAAGTRALPAGYTQLEYAEKKGKDVRVNTGAKEDFTGRIEAKVSFGSDSSSSDYYLWGVFRTDNIKMFTFGCKEGKMQIAYSQETVTLPTAPVANEPYHVTIDYGKKTYSVVRMSTDEAQTGTLSEPADTATLAGQIQIFAANGVPTSEGAGSYQKSAADGSRIYYLRYYDANGTAKLDLVPAKNASGTVVFYDAVSSGDKTASGTALVAGPSIMAVDGNTSLTAAKTVDKLLIASGATLDQNGQTFAATDITAVPSGYTRLASLHVNNNVVFKTPYKPASSDKAEIKVKFTERSTVSGSKVLFGARSAQSGNKDAMAFWHWWDTSDYVRFDYGTGNSKTKVSDLGMSAIETNKDYIFSLKSGEALVKNGDGQTLADYSSKLGSASVANNASYMWLLGYTGADTKSNANSSQYYACSTDFYWFKATDANDGTVVRCHFVPARRESDGTVGVLDLTGNYGFVAPTIISGGAVTAGAAVPSGAATLAVSSRVSVSGAVTAYAPLALAKSSAASGDVIVSTPGTLSGAGGITVGSGVTLNVGVNRLNDVGVAFEQGAGLALQLTSATDSPVVKVASEPSSVKVYGVDGTTLIDYAATAYDTSAGTVTVTLPVPVWRDTKGNGSFDDVDNWSLGALPAAGVPFEVELSADTEITVSGNHSLAGMAIRGTGTATFAGDGSIAVTKASVAAGAALATGGKVSFPAIDLPAGATATLPDPSMLANGRLVGGGTLVLAPGAGNTVTMSGGNKSWTGQTIIENGTVKYTGGRSFGNEDTTANVLVKGGATLDQNGVRWLLENSEKPAVRLEEDAVLTSSGDIDDNKGGVITKLSLAGDATVLADEHMVYMSKHYNAAYVTIELGTHTLKKTGNGEFFISVCNITGTGTLDIQNGIVSVTHPYSGSSYGKCSNGTINIREGGEFRIRNYNGKAAEFSVNTLVLNGRVERDVGADHMLTVTGSITGKGTATMLAMAPGAKFKPNGADYLTIVESLSGAMAVDMTGLDVSSAVNIPLFRLGKAVSGPSVAGFDLNWELKISNSGDYVCYDLVRKPASVHIDEIGADVALPADWLKNAGMQTAFDDTPTVKTFAESTGANGLPVWKSYCLGLDPASASSVVLCEPAPGVDVGEGKIAIAANVSVPAGLEGVVVTATLESSTGGGSWQTAGAATVVPGGSPVFTVDGGSGETLTLYRMKIDIAKPE